MPDFEDEYLDVLQNIEFAIVSVYRNHKDLTDYEVDEALSTLARAYRAEREQKAFTKPDLSELAAAVHSNVEAMCDIRLGRESLVTPDGGEMPVIPRQVTVEELIACLKRIRKSIRRWTRVGGTRGYLQNVDQFIV
ncbi:MAG: hypothetical protein JXB35_00985 [Anaerolineae bacterium]|nr:hypothetical protein [Anaerolineae bacterium]